MNAENMQKPRVMKETKNKIRVEFERTSRKERLKARFLNVAFLTNIVWALFRYILLVGVSYIVLYPFISKIAASLMGPNDFVNATVRLIPTKINFDIYKMVFIEMEYMKAFWNTLFLSGSTALLQTLMCCVISYGLAKFRFKGNKYIFYLVILTMIVPHQTVQLSLYMAFRYFDILGIFQFLGGGGITIFGKTFLQGVIDLAPEASKVWSATGLNLIKKEFRDLGAEKNEYYDELSRKLLTIAQLIMSGARFRRESRGGHYREDYPTLKEEFAVHTIQQKGHPLKTKKVNEE
jgi:hypothetical protein